MIAVAVIPDGSALDKERVVKRGYSSGAWGWKTAYKETIAT